MAENEEEIVARMRRAYEAFNRGDYDAAVEPMDEEVELGRTGGQSALKGKEAVRAWMQPDAMEEQRFEPQEFRVNGDKVFVRTHTRTRGRGSGIELETEMFIVYTVGDNGMFIRIEGFFQHERDQALRAAGLSEG